MRVREGERQTGKDSGGWDREGRKGKHGRVYFSKLPSEESIGVQDFHREFGPLAAERAAQFYSRAVALVDTIAVLFFSPFRLFSLPFRPFRYFFHSISRRAPSVWIQYSSKWHDRGKPQKSDGRSTCFASRNAGALILAYPENFHNKKLNSKQKTHAIFYFICAIIDSNGRKARRIERIIRKSLINSHQNLEFKDFPLNHSLDNRSSSA